MAGKQNVNPLLVMNPAVRALLEQIQKSSSQSTPQAQMVTIGGPTIVTGTGSSAVATSSASGVRVQSNLSSSQIVYSYKVKIINPNKKSEASTRHLNDFKAKFDSVNALRLKLIEAFQSAVPNTMDFGVGYFERSQKTKMSVVVMEDLKAMYNYYPRGGSITLWCDARCEDESRKRKRETETSKKSAIEENEDDVEDVYQTLLEKHGETWDIPKLRLWARCICTKTHKSYDVPPDLPAFKEQEPKKRRESLSDALTGAAVAFAQSFKTPNKSVDVPAPQLERSQGVSPGKTVELRMKNYEQLRYLQKLYDDGILSEMEYTEQKRNILDFLRKIQQ